MSKVIAWEKPPRTFIDEVSDLVGELRDRPFDWALVLEEESALEVGAWSGNLDEFPDIENRYVEMDVAGGTYNLYARSIKLPTTWREL